MRRALLNYLRCPVTGSPFDLFPFATSGKEAEDVRTGLLRSQDGHHLYPVVNGVPSLLPNSFPRDFLETFAGDIQTAVGHVPAADRQSEHTWSFSDEWDTFFDHKLTRTWGWSKEERVRMLLLETQLPREAFQGALVCDAGCGNGLLTQAIAELGATVIGIDYSTSVFRAESCRHSDRVHYVRGDLMAPPFAPDLFDVIISNGVLHHTPNTRRTFNRVAELVKPQGSFYLWLYRRSRNWKVRLLRMRETLVRPVCVHLPRVLRKAMVYCDASVLWFLTRVFGRRKLSYREALVNAHDALTPYYAWQHHTPLEVASWFYEQGFTAPSLTHWDNPIGFGVVARKQALPDTPGVNFGRQATRRHYI